MPGLRGDDPALTQSVTASCTTPASKPQSCERAGCLHALSLSPSLSLHPHSQQCKVGWRGGGGAGGGGSRREPGETKAINGHCAGLAALSGLTAQLFLSLGWPGWRGQHAASFLRSVAGPGPGRKHVRDGGDVRTEGAAAKCSHGPAFPTWLSGILSPGRRTKRRKLCTLWQRGRGIVKDVQCGKNKQKNHKKTR